MSQALVTSIFDEWSCRIESRPDAIVPAVTKLTERLPAFGTYAEEQIGFATMALVEAITNSVIHGNLEVSSNLKLDGMDAFARVVSERCNDLRYSKRLVTIHMNATPKECTWRITDEGHGFNVEEALLKADDDLPHEDIPCGRGLVMIRAMMSDVRWSEGGRTCTMTLAAKEGSAATGRSVMLPAAVQSDEDAASAALVTNVDTSGLALLHRGPVRASRLELTVSDRDGQSITVPVKVLKIDELGGNLLRVECRFEENGESPQAKDIGDRIEALLCECAPEKEPHDERRTHRRFEFARPVRFETLNGREGSGFGRNLSRGGVAFISESEIPFGTAITLSLPMGGQTLKVGGTVVRAHRLGRAFFDYGVMFS